MIERIVTRSTFAVRNRSAFLYRLLVIINLEKGKELAKMYANKWNVNANLNLESGLYEWAEEAISQYRKVLEIGCGTGQSTITFLRRDHKVYAVDMDSDCISYCEKMVLDEGYSVYKTSLNEKITFSDEDTTLLRADFSGDIVRILKHLDPNVVVMWNPGGWETTDWSQEKGAERIWQLIDSVIEYAESKDIPFMLLNRFSTVKKADTFWNDVANSTKMKMSYQANRWEHQEPEGGVPLIDNGKHIADIYYSVAVFVPEETE